MPVGIGELLLLAVLLLVAFGPRKQGEKFSLARWAVRVGAVIAPAAVLLDRAGAALGLMPLHRLALVAASTLATTFSLAILAAVDRMRERAQKKAKVRASTPRR